MFLDHYCVGNGVFLGDLSSSVLSPVSFSHGTLPQTTVLNFNVVIVFALEILLSKSFLVFLHSEPVLQSPKTSFIQWVMSLII
jgi:hypothetical protein